MVGTQGFSGCLPLIVRYPSKLEGSKEKEQLEYCTKNTDCRQNRGLEVR